MMPADPKRPLRRGGFLGRRVDKVTTEAEHYLRCPACGGLIDIRNLAQVIEHAGPLPHPPTDRP
jgi:hypothetical protein